MNALEIINAAVEKAEAVAAATAATPLDVRIAAGEPLAKAWVEANLSHIVFDEALRQSKLRASASYGDLKGTTQISHVKVYSRGNLVPEGFPKVPGLSFDLAVKGIDGLNCITYCGMDGELIEMYLTWGIPTP